MTVLSWTPGIWAVIAWKDGNLEWVNNQILWQGFITWSSQFELNPEKPINLFFYEKNKSIGLIINKFQCSVFAEKIVM